MQIHFFFKIVVGLSEEEEEETGSESESEDSEEECELESFIEKFELAVTRVFEEKSKQYQFVVVTEYEARRKSLEEEKQALYLQTKELELKQFQSSLTKSIWDYKTEKEELVSAQAIQERMRLTNSPVFPTCNSVRRLFVSVDQSMMSLSLLSILRGCASVENAVLSFEHVMPDERDVARLPLYHARGRLRGYSCFQTIERLEILGISGYPWDISVVECLLGFPSLVSCRVTAWRPPVGSEYLGFYIRMGMFQNLNPTVT